MLKTHPWRRLATPLALAVLLALAGAARAQAQREAPQYGGTLEAVTEYFTLSALSFDPYDWSWKANYDTSFYLEHLIAGDMDKAVSRGGKHRFLTDAWLPRGVQRGELAESWQMVDKPLSVVFKLRKGIMWPEKPGVMKAREFVADDVVFSYTRLASSPKKIPTYFDHIDRVEAKDKHTVVFYLKEFNAEWDYRFGYGYYDQIVPKELADAGAKDWKNATGTGPFQLADYLQGNSHTYVRNDKYWDQERIGGKDYKLPYLDKIVYRIIPDEATHQAALRAGKIDLLRTVRWQSVENLKQSAPQLIWYRYLPPAGHYLSMRVDTKPFSDIRVRRALNMAVNKQEIVKEYYGGNAELFSYPMHPEWEGLYEPLEKMPPGVRELFRYDPEQAKKLLAEAGYPNGFEFKVQVCSCNPNHMELLPLVAGYLEKVGVRLDIQPMEYPAYLSAMTTKTVAAGYFHTQSHTNPTTVLRKNFGTGQTWNPSQYADAKFDAALATMYKTRDEKERNRMIRAMTAEILEAAPYVWLPTPHNYQAWWPWVKNYQGEGYVGALRAQPILARVWIDQELKKKMGY
jgi:peptide/nickel transport system substrate-binding protein